MTTTAGHAHTGGEQEGVKPARAPQAKAKQWREAKSSGGVYGRRGARARALAERAGSGKHRLRQASARATPLTPVRPHAVEAASLSFAAANARTGPERPAAVYRCQLPPAPGHSGGCRPAAAKPGADGRVRGWAAHAQDGGGRGGPGHKNRKEGMQHATCSEPQGSRQGTGTPVWDRGHSSGPPNNRAGLAAREARRSALGGRNHKQHPRSTRPR